VIVAVDGAVVCDPDPLYAALDAANPGDVALKIVRGVQELILVARLGDQS
jgi:S1-C subfamily serine protease